MVISTISYKIRHGLLHICTLGQAIKKSTGELDWRILENKNFEILLDFTGFLLSSTGFLFLVKK